MKNTWRHYLRRLVATTVVGGSVAWSSAMCYAVAFDNADDPTYAAGWQEGQNGGSGFGAWNFDGTSVNLNYNSAQDSQEIDNGLMTGAPNSSPYNNLGGKAWTIYNFNGRNPPPGPSNPPSGSTDIARAGRSFSPLQPGETLSVIIDNPTERAYFRGYFIRLNGSNGSPGNICYAGAPCTPGTTPVSKFAVGTFDYFTYGQWFMTDVPGSPEPGVPLYDKDDPVNSLVGTDSGMRLDFTLTGADTFTATMTPLDNPGAAFTHSGPLDNPGVPVNWIEFTFFNTDSDFYTTMVSGAQPTDFYIRSIEITDAAPPDQPGDHNKDGKVNAADYVAWREMPDAFGGDPGGYNTWRENFAEGGAGGSGAVPEPVTFVYLVAGAIGLGSLAVRRGRGG